jgi:hypothetical protein
MEFQRALDDTTSDYTRQQNFLTDLLSRVLYFERKRHGPFGSLKPAIFEREEIKQYLSSLPLFLCVDISFHGLIIYRFLLFAGNINLIFEASTLAIATINF